MKLSVFEEVNSLDNLARQMGSVRDEIKQFSENFEQESKSLIEDAQSHWD